MLDDVKSALLPLTPAEARWEALLERLPRSRVPAVLRPAHQIEVLDLQRGEYRSLGGTPWFDLHLESDDLDDSWLYVEGVLQRNGGSRQACLQALLPGAAGSVYRWPVTTNLRGSIREVIHLPKGFRQLRWMPTASHGYFTQSALLIHRIGLLESSARRWYRVALHRRRLHDAALPIPVELSTRWVLRDLQRAYRWTAEMRAEVVHGTDYALWLQHQTIRDRKAAAKLTTDVAQLARPPVFSFVLDIGDATPGTWTDTVDSVRAQQYRHWQLLLISDKPVPVGLVEAHAGARDRVHLIQRYPEQGKEGILDIAVRLATGDFVCLVKPGDRWHADALMHLALFLDRHPDAVAVYGDEDRLDASGQRNAPAFKPDWNPDLLLSCNYVGSAVMFRRDGLVDGGAIGNDAAGAEAYGLLLRLLAQDGGVHIHHLARVVCSTPPMRLMASASPSDGPEDAPCVGAQYSELRVLRAHLRGSGVHAYMDPATSAFRLHYPLPSLAPLVSMIVPTRDRLDILRQCITSITMLTDYPHWELLVIDNGSSEPETLRYLGDLAVQSRIRVLRQDGPFNYSALNNQAVRHARGEVLALLNNDLEVIDAGWLREMVSHALRPRVGAVGAKLLYPDRTVQHAGVVIGIGGVAAHVHKFLLEDDPGYCGRASVVQNMSAVTGACLVVQTRLYRAVGGLDEQHLAVAFNDIDFCLKLRDAGYRNVYTPHARLIHHESLSRGRDDTPAKRAVFQREFAHMRAVWGAKLQHDPAYNPNLTLDFGDFSFAYLARDSANGR